MACHISTFNYIEIEDKVKNEDENKYKGKKNEDISKFSHQKNENFHSYF